MNLDMWRIEWIDSEHYGENWTDRAKVEKWARDDPCPTIVSVGQVLHMDENHVVLVQGAYNDSVGAVFKIPKFAIRKMRRLVEVD